MRPEWLKDAIVLRGQFVHLVPLQIEHFAALQKIAVNGAIWQHLPADCSTEDKFGKYYNSSTLDFSEQNHYVFTIINAATNEVVGSTRFFTISTYDAHLEIGWTWLEPSLWGTAINAEMKMLLLTYAFETLGMVRVQFKASDSNMRSRSAIQHLGAVYEGTLRKERLRDDGTFRNASYYSILDTEWATAKPQIALYIQRKSLARVTP